MQWLQDPNYSNVYNLSYVRLFRIKKKGHLKAKIDELETNGKIKNIRDLYRAIDDFKKGCQSRNNIVRDEKGDWFADSHSNLARCRNHFSKLFDVRGISDGRQTEIHTAEPLVPEPSTFEFVMTIERLKRHNSPGFDQIPTGLIKAGGRTIRSEIHKLINSIWKRKELPEDWKESIIVPIYKKGDKTDRSNYRGM
jgi:hypothetical protein